MRLLDLLKKLTSSIFVTGCLFGAVSAQVLDPGIVDKIDDRRKVDRSKLMNSVGIIRCTHEKHGENLVPFSVPVEGTATIVIPPKPNERRSFETLLTAKHLFVSEAGHRRSNCTFHIDEGDNSGFPVHLPSYPDEVPRATIDYMANDLAIAVVHHRLTANDRTLASCSNSEISEQLVPFEMITIEENNYLEKAISIGASGSDMTIEFEAVIGFDKQTDSILGASSRGAGSSSVIGGIDDDCRVVSFDSVEMNGVTTDGKLIYSSCDGSTGSSGGPAIVGLRGQDKLQLQQRVFGVKVGWLSTFRLRNYNIIRRITPEDITSGVSIDNPDLWGVQEFHNYYKPSVQYRAEKGQEQSKIPPS